MIKKWSVTPLDRYAGTMVLSPICERGAEFFDKGKRRSTHIIEAINKANEAGSNKGRIYLFYRDLL